MCQRGYPQGPCRALRNWFNVRGMSPFETFLADLPTVDSLQGFNRAAALASRCRPATVTAWGRIHDVYFGATKWTKQQRRALEAARAGAFDLDRLSYIENRLTAIDDEGERWRVRHKLLAVHGSFAALRQAAKDLIPPTAPRMPKAQVTFSCSTLGMRTMRVTASERDIADLEHALRQHVDSSRPAAPQMLDAFLSLLRDGTSIPHAAPRPIVLAPLPEHIQILSGDGEDVTLVLTDGTTMTGAEYLNLTFGEIALFHPQAGAVNLYRTQRFANQKQRDLARLLMPRCPFPSCRHGADSCEIHHITAWKHGGETNMDNLAPLCSYHNRVNDDDPWHTSRGRIEIINGTPTWVSPSGVPVPVTEAGAMQQLFG